MKKGTLLTTKRGDKTYQVIGHWDKDIVLRNILLSEGLAFMKGL